MPNLVIFYFKYYPIELPISQSIKKRLYFLGVRDFIDLEIEIEENSRTSPLMQRKQILSPSVRLIEEFEAMHQQREQELQKKKLINF